MQTSTRDILDNDFFIESFSFDLPSNLGYPSQQLNKMDFQNILANPIQPLWNSIKKQIIQDNSYHNTIHLLFVTAEKQIIPSFCTVTRLLYTNKIIISSITTILQDTVIDHGHTIHPIVPRPSEASIIQNVYDYILNNLEKPLPSTKKLSKMFGVNEFTLKDGFNVWRQ